MKIKGKPSAGNDWLNVIAKELGAAEEKIPAGWMTMNQIMERLGMTNGEANTFCRRAIRLKKMQRKQFVARTPLGLKPVWHYWGMQ